MPSRTLHVLGVPHTVANDDYTVCAFTSKVLHFPGVIQPFGWSVVEYSNEGSASDAQHHVVILSKQQFQSLSKRTSREDAHDADVDNVALQQEFQRVLLQRLAERARPGDIVCHVWGPNIEACQLVPQCHHVELSVGYTASPGLPFRIYESSAWMHWHHGKAGREDGSHYQWVIPSKLDSEKWPLCEEPDDYAIFLGRITQRKGMNELCDIARRVPSLHIRAYGPGDVSPWTANQPPNLTFAPAVFGAERLQIVQRAACMLMPTVFIEPFGNSGVEAQLCGVPLIASSFGAFQETIVEGVTGYRCHTLADWATAIDFSQSLDRRKISTLAHAKYSKESIGSQFDWALRQLADLSGEGWYGPVSRKFATPKSGTPKRDSSARMWLFIPYFGSLPNYFQLYLDSLAMNEDHITVILLTDSETSAYRLPVNIIVHPMTFAGLKSKMVSFLRREFDWPVTEATILQNPYKLCDFKVFYPELFFEIGERYGVGPDDLVGWGDCDLIYGRFADFIERVGAYDLIGGYHGHLTAMRNVSALRTLYHRVGDLLELLSYPEYKVVDEQAFRLPLFEHVRREGLEVFDIYRHFCDVIPNCFFGMFRPDHAKRSRNFFEGNHPEKDIRAIVRDETGRLIVNYDDGSTREVIYCHLQKRAMSVNVPPGRPSYEIHEFSFEPRAVASVEERGDLPSTEFQALARLS